MQINIDEDARAAPVLCKCRCQIDGGERLAGALRRSAHADRAPLVGHHPAPDASTQNLVGAQRPRIVETEDDAIALHRDVVERRWLERIAPRGGGAPAGLRFAGVVARRAWINALLRRGLIYHGWFVGNVAVDVG